MMHGPKNVKIIGWVRVGYCFQVAVNEAGLNLTAFDPVNMSEALRDHNRFDPSRIDSVSMPASFVRQTLHDSTRFVWKERSVVSPLRLD